MLAIAPDAIRFQHPPAHQVVAQVGREVFQEIRTRGKLALPPLAQFRHLAVDRDSRIAVAGCQNPHAGPPLGIAAEDALLLDVREEGGHRVEVPGQERIELVVVALGASERRAEPDRRNVAHAVRRVFRQVFRSLGSALVRHPAQAVVPARHQLPGRGFDEQVAGQLLPGHHVKRLVLVERPDDVVAERIDVDRNVSVVTDGVGIADEVQPVNGHPLAEVRRVQERFQKSPVAVGIPVSGEGLDHGRVGRQPGQVEAEPARQGPAVGLGDRLQVVGGQLPPHKEVDCRRPGRSVRSPGLAVGPMFLVLGTLLDPLRKDPLLRASEDLVRRPRRHHQERIRVRDPLNQPARRGVARLDHAAGQRIVPPVESEPRLAGVRVGAVAGEAVLRKDRPDIPVELDSVSTPQGASGEQAAAAKPGAIFISGPSPPTTESRSAPGSSALAIPASGKLRWAAMSVANDGRGSLGIHAGSTVLGFVLTLGASVAGAQPDRPNIVVLLADDLGYGSVSWYGSDIPTPHIDSVARNGVGFVAGYVTAPVCNPSRPALMTGRYPQRWGKELNSQTVPPEGAARKSLPTSETTLADALKAEGYATGAVGKWQLGMADGYHPLDRGFDSFFGMPSDRVSSTRTGRTRASRPGHEDPGEPDAAGRIRGLFRGREPVEMDEYLTDRLGREGVEFIRRHQDEPFFLYLAFHAPHGPIQTIDKYYQRFPAIENETARIYAAMISALDDWVGAVLDALRRHGLEENTLVIFASDNGAARQSDVDGKRNSPLIGHKRNLYEGGIRVPYALQWKGRIKAGTRFESPVSTLDIFPTALAAAGSAAAGSAELDGVNLLPFVADGPAGRPHDYLVWRSGPNAAVRSGAWKLLLTRSGLARLYNVREDPGESRDLASSQPRVVADLRRALARWERGKVAPRKGARTVKTKYNGDLIEWHI